ncbi:MAG TPA: ATP-dependent DNA helicase RecG [Mycobacteriales bacterium]|nr:ATP-dependent DNA helicase RecG [Mycobacteriales bacterium]
MVDQSTPLRKLLGSSAATLEKAFGYATCGDLLHHYPRRYAERAVLTPLAELAEDEYVTVMAEIAKVDSRPMRNRRGSLLEVWVTDGSGRLKLTFFNQAWRAKQLRPGMRGLFAGRVSSFRGVRQLTHPDYQLLDDDTDGADPRLLSGLIPVYPATTKLPSWNLAKAIQTLLDTIDLGPDALPEPVRAARDLLPLERALHFVHRPDEWSQVTAAHKRLRFDEAFVMQVELARRRVLAALEPTTPRAARPGGLLEAFDAQLPFTLTDGQQQVSAEVFADLGREVPMQRLLQGEVGSGKTVVALRAMLAVVDSGGQAALLAPTEVLAQQHARSIDALLGPLGRQGQLDGAETATRLALITGSMGAAARRQALLDVGVGDAGIVIGTHALLERTVQFFDLGLVVVDEQHRFGVEQRSALRDKASTPPHVLVMTATPIPRTVAMTVYGDLETSTLRELPGGRKPIATTVVPVRDQPAWVDRVWERAREEVSSGRQVYVVCPRISGDDDTLADADGEPVAPAADDEASAARESWAGVAAVNDVAPMLADGPLVGLRIDMLHGRLPADAKDDVMRRFAAGEIDVLVATTVIEVGVDVANATTMIVLDADRFGISQLHQLRGRVGRGSHGGLCLLVTASSADSAARERLDGVASTLDGFALARLDLEQRREGDVLGASQSGRRSHLRLLRLLRDEDVIADARADAQALVDADPALESHPALRAAADALGADDRADYLEKT